MFPACTSVTRLVRLFMALLFSVLLATAARAEKLDELDPRALKTVDLPNIDNPKGGLELEYLVYVGGFRIGVIHLDAVWDGERYILDSRVKTEGLAELLVQARYHNSAHGAFDGKRVAPTLYGTHYRTRSDKQIVRIGFDGSGPTDVFSEPKYSNRRKVTKQDKHLSVDPMSSFLYMMLGSSVSEDAPCGERVPIFDGKRRYDFKLKYVKKMTISSNDEGSYNGPGLHCKVQYEEVAGFRERDKNEDPYPWVNVYMANVNDGEILIPVRFSLKTPYGGLVGRAVKVVVK